MSEFTIRIPRASVAISEATLIEQLVEEGGAWFGPEFRVTVQILPAATVDTTPGNAGGCNASGGAGCLVALALLGLRRRKR